MKDFKLNRSNPLIEVGKNALSWQIIDKEGNLICDFRGPMSMMCCMAALERMNDPNYTMSQAQDIYSEN